MHLNPMNNVMLNNSDITEPYYKKAEHGGGYIVYAPTEKKCGNGKRTVMSPIKKFSSEKAAVQHVLSISQSNH